MSMAHLQIALDLLSIADALTIAEASVKGGADWLEVGTPLIKNHGTTAINKLKASFPDRTIVADMKTVDTGDLEVEIAAKNGADVVCVLGMAGDFTIKRAVNQARAHEVKVMADLLGVDDKLQRARELEDLGVDYILLHTPLDIQKVKEEKVDASLELLRELTRQVGIPVAVAGGITLETARYLKEAGADIFVVGRTVTKAKDVEGTVRKLCSSIGVEVIEREEEEVPEEELIRGFEELPTPFISDAMKRFGAMRGLRPLVKGKRIAGRAFTVRTLGGDWGKVVKAVDAASEGDIIVVDAQGVEIAVWGELATRSAMARGIKGVIIDGAVRDSDDIRALGYPVWARSIVPNAGEPHGHGKLGARISCAGQPVSPGDVVVADEVGVVVVPGRRAGEVLKKSREIALKERRYKEEIEAGKTLSEIFGL
ncbi:MAG: bifunctional hexulose-6-phosphate synthase/ribonuclease regulator [Euryarchaeota archaeon]|nr:bifunctional hexulose-6-phosphate synthase/ribonuclease regulator [Euryarchaeota archaeon]